MQAVLSLQNEGAPVGSWVVEIARRLDCDASATAGQTSSSSSTSSDESGARDAGMALLSLAAVCDHEDEVTDLTGHNAAVALQLAPSGSLKRDRSNRAPGLGRGLQHANPNTHGRSQAE